LTNSAPRIRSGSANPSPKLATLIAGMCAGADSIDDPDIVRSGGMKTFFGGVYAPSTIGTLLREFSFGHARRLESVLREHLAGLCKQVDKSAQCRFESDWGHCEGAVTVGKDTLR
jgi:hypothetical protein